MNRRPDPLFSAMAEPDGTPLVAEFQCMIDPASLGRRGSQRDVATTEAERGAIARYLDLVALDALEATVRVRPWRKGLVLTGMLRARVVQSCVVSLEPVEAEIAQDFERRYLPADILAREAASDVALGEIEVDVAEGEVPEALPPRGIPLADIVVEELSLALNPFPRAAGAQAVPPEHGEGDPHPFAALAGLRRQD